MATELKACTNSRYRRTNTVMIVICSILTVFSLVMAIVSIAQRKYLFMAAWIIAMILLATYIIIRINTIFTTSISTDTVNLYMKNWSNDFLPYDYSYKIKILSEFVPAKTKTLEIPISEIRTIIIGTKNYIKRNLDSDTDFAKNIRALENSKDFYRKHTISSMDIFYVETHDGECCYMPIVQFGTRELVKILQTLRYRNPGIVIKSGSRAFKRLISE